MPGSQLKRLKASLREQGLRGPRQSKKQRRQNAQDNSAGKDKRLQRGVVLEGIREQFNPFDLKHATRGPKFEVTTSRPASNGIKGRPSEARAAGEERRRQTLLVDMQRRNKVGGILDRRFGENDATMTAEEKAVERFAREKQRNYKKMSMFDLEGDDDPLGALTHGGKSIAFDDIVKDDFKEDDLDLEDDSDQSDLGKQRLKRLRDMAAAEGPGDDDEPQRKKSKKEVMDEVMAKSKLHKMERQAAKEQDDDLREELDKELSDIRQLLFSTGKSATRTTTGGQNGGTIAGVDRTTFERDFDVQVKRLAQDSRAQPSERTKSEEEKAKEASERLAELEQKRQRRMRGEEITDSEAEDNVGDGVEDIPAASYGATGFDDNDDDYGLGQGVKVRTTATDLGFDDEDDFFIEDDLIASGSELGSIASEDSSDQASENSDSDNEADDSGDEFLKDLLTEEEARNPVFDKASKNNQSADQTSDEQGLPYTFACAESCDELLSMTAPFPSQSLPTIVQRTRALHHPKLDSKNKERLAKFSIALIDYICLPWDPESSAPSAVVESLIRHVHSLAKMFPLEIGARFRYHLEQMSQLRPLDLLPADLFLLTAIGSIFPTSDHFHTVVTPAMLTMTRYLGQKMPRDLSSFATGTYISILALQYQQLAKRYVPELLNFALHTIMALAPKACASQVGNFPSHGSLSDMRSTQCKDIQIRRLHMSDCISAFDENDALSSSLKVAILATMIELLDVAADTWSGKAAILETFNQVQLVLKHFLLEESRKHLPKALITSAVKLNTKFDRIISLARLSRKNLELHHHKPLAIKTFIPKYEETFDPDKHYDPDRDRAELAKLRAEHKKERKGAMRELRKDASFMAREKLRLKKVKDEAYEKKYKRLVAEIQSEEGKEANAYERERSARKRARTK